MTLLAPPTVSSAEQMAVANFAANVAALQAASSSLRTQLDPIARTHQDRAEKKSDVPLNKVDITLFSSPPSWVFGRDGSLTARFDASCWLGGTSLPRRVAQAQLKQLDLVGPVSCFLAPPHSAALRVALDRAASEQAIIAIVPAIEALAGILHCDNFSTEFAAGRLWFVAGENWAAKLSELLDVEPGLSIPTQFIRLNTALPEIVDPMIVEAQKIFSAATGTRSMKAQQLRSSWRANQAQRICVVAPSKFRLWNDWGYALRAMFGSDSNIEWLDCDDPRATSSLALCQSAARCDAFVAANFARSAAPSLLPDAMPWICWAADGRVPAFVPAGTRDRLIVIDEHDRARAQQMGWPVDAIECVPPGDSTAITSDAFEADVTVIADTCPIEAPKRLEEFSSQLPMWAAIAAEIAADPFALLDIELSDYLDDRAARFNVPTNTLDVPLFIDRLIVPAYQQAVVKRLIDGRVRVAVYGKGWGQLPFAADAWRGEMADRSAFHSACRSARALLNVWPIKRGHPVEFAGRPIVRAGRTMVQSIRALPSVEKTREQLSRTEMEQRLVEFVRRAA